MRYLYILLALIAVGLVVVSPVMAQDDNSTFDMFGNITPSVHIAWKNTGMVDQWFDYGVGWYNDVCWGITLNEGVQVHHHDAGHPSGDDSACAGSTVDADNMADLEMSTNYAPATWDITFDNTETGINSKMQHYNPVGTKTTKVSEQDLMIALCSDEQSLTVCKQPNGSPESYAAFESKTRTGTLTGGEVTKDYWANFQFNLDSPSFAAGSYRAGVKAILTITPT